MENPPRERGWAIPQDVERLHAALAHVAWHFWSMLWNEVFKSKCVRMHAHMYVCANRHTHQAFTYYCARLDLICCLKFKNSSGCQWTQLGRKRRSCGQCSSGSFEDAVLGSHQELCRISASRAFQGGHFGFLEGYRCPSLLPGRSHTLGVYSHRGRTSKQRQNSLATTAQSLNAKQLLGRLRPSESSAAG